MNKSKDEPRLVEEGLKSGQKRKFGILNLMGKMSQVFQL